MRKSIIGSLAAAGFMLLGCGGVEPSDMTSPDLATSEDAVVDCTGRLDYTINFYSDATRTTIVGAHGCTCESWFKWGYTTSYSQRSNYPNCN